MNFMINKKTMMLLISLFVLVIGLSAVSAKDVAGDEAVILDDGAQTVGDVDSVEVDNNVVTATNIVSAVDNNDKLGTSYTASVSNYTQFCEELEKAKIDTTNDEYVINIESGNYTVDNPGIWGNATGSVRKLTINGNNQTSNRFFINNVSEGYTIEINNFKMASNTNSEDDGVIVYGTMLIKNSEINCALGIYGNVSIENSTTTSWGNGVFITHNFGQLTFINDTIGHFFNIWDNSTLIVDDETQFQGSDLIRLKDNGTIVTNNINRLEPYLYSIYGNITFENITIGAHKNCGNLTLINATITRYIENQGNLTLKNCTLNNGVYNGVMAPYSNNPGYNGRLIIEDDIIISSSGGITGTGAIEIDNINRIAQFLDSFNGTYTVENITFTKSTTNYGNLTLKNMIIDRQITNNANLTFVNCTVSSTVNNNGNLLIDDDTTFTSSATLSGNGGVEVDDFNRIAPYISVFNGTYTLENMTLTNSITNYGNLSLINSTVSSTMNNGGNLTLKNMVIDKQITNNANLTFVNCTVSSTVNNNGNLFIDEDTTFTYSATLSGNGEIEINDINRIIPYMTVFNGTYTLENLTLTKSITNYGNLTIKNATLNSSITNNGVLIIDDDVVFGGNFALSGNGQIVIDDMTKIFPYINKINGTYDISNYEFSKRYTFDGDVTLNNCTITSTQYLINRGILIINNCTVNTTGNWIRNYGTGILVINNETNIISGNIDNRQGTVLYGERPVEFYPIPSTFTGENNVENKTFAIPSTNEGTLNITDSTILATITNNGNITIKNTTINATIYNYGIITVDDDVIFTENCQLQGTGTYIINDANRIAPYMNVFNGTYTIKNMVLEPITNYGNLTLINVTFENHTKTISRIGYGFIVNNAVLTIINSTFRNNIIEEDIGFGEYAMYRSGYGGVIYNNGSLNVINSNFTDNFANRGGVIAYSNTQAGTKENTGLVDIEIINCTFSDNHAAYGGGVLYVMSYDDYSVIIENSTFQRNYARWHTRNANGAYGGVLHIRSNNCSMDVLINNCTFEENHADILGQYGGHGADGGAILITGANLTLNNSTFNDNYGYSETGWNAETGQGGAVFVSDVNATISNNTFNNNYLSTAKSNNNGYDPSNIISNAGGGSIRIDGQNVLFENNVINNSSSTKLGGAIWINGTNSSNATFKNNTFTNNLNNSETVYAYGLNVTSFNNTYVNSAVEFENFTISAPDKVYPNTSVEITGVAILAHPAGYDSDLLDRMTYDFYNGDVLINTTDSLNISVYKNDTNNMILYAVPSINPDQSTNILVLKTNTVSNVLITPDNYSSYIFKNQLIGIDEDTNITFQGDFANKGVVNVDVNYITLNGQDATFVNTTFHIDADHVNMFNMNIDNTDTSSYAIDSVGNNNQFVNNTIRVNNSAGLTAAISAQSGENTTIDANTITVYGPAYNTIQDGVAIISSTQAILVKDSSNIKVTNNRIDISNSTDPEINSYSTIEAITVNENIENATISYNNVTATGARFVYAIDSLNTINNVNITYNNVNVSGHRYTDGIQTGNDATNIIIAYNNITTECHNETEFDADNEAISYGIITSNMGGGVSENITIHDNNIKQNSTINYGMEIYQTQNTNITGNNITGNGAFSMGIGFAHSPNSIVTDNNMMLNGDSDADVNYIVEELRPANTGVQIQQDSNNINIENNNIKTNDVAKKDSAVTTDSTQTTVTNNKFTTSTTNGDAAVKTNKADTIIENNTKALYSVTVTIEDATANVLDEVNLTVNVINELGEAFTGGRVSFKVNGNYLKDANGEYVRANVINGTATATVTIAKQYIGENTLVAYFTGNSKYDKALSNEATLTVGKQDVTITIDPVEATVTESMTITAHITDANGNVVSGGRVSFKVNGNYLKDENGNYIYANVKDGIVSINTTALNRWVGDNSTIQVCFGGNNYYNSAKSTEDAMTINKVNVTVTIAPITTTKGSTAQFTAFVMTDNGKLISNGRVGFKVNGITLRNADSSAIYANVNNGVAVAVAQVLDRWTEENTIQAVYGGTSIYNTARSTLSTMSITE